REAETGHHCRDRDELLHSSFPPSGAGPRSLSKPVAAGDGSSAACGWKCSWIRCASLGVTFGTAASSATLDSRTRRAEPKDLSRLVRMVGPMPGIASSTDWIVRRVRSFL